MAIRDYFASSVECNDDAVYAANFIVNNTRVFWCGCIFICRSGTSRLEKDKIARKQQKLLEAHYADAIPLDLLKQEQAVLERAMADIEARFSALEQNYTDVKKNLDMVLELAIDAKRLYAAAPDHIKKLLNQVFFEKVLVHAHDDVKPERTPIFEALLSAQTKQLAVSSELFGQPLPQKMISYARCLSKQLLVTSRRIELRLPG